jgi:hypothetical protein
MKYFCECGDLIIGKRKINVRNTIFYFCDVCNNYYDTQLNKHSKEELDKAIEEKRLLEQKEREIREKENKKRFAEMIENLLATGKQHLNSGDYEAASLVFKEVLGYEKDNAVANILLKASKDKIEENKNKLPLLIFKDISKLKRDSNDIFYLHDYHKYRVAEGVVNPLFDQISGLMLSLKKNEPVAVKLFLEEFRIILREDKEWVLCVMPSHNKGLELTGTRIIAKSLKLSSIIDGSECLERIEQVKDNHSGNGRRTYQEEYESLGIQKEYIIKDKIVLLIDDISTRGTSLLAGQKKIKEAGAKDVICFAFGKTVFE